MHRDSLSLQQLALPTSLRKTAVGPNDPVPRQLLVRARQDAADEAGRARIDVAVGADESLGNLTHADENARGAVQPN